MENVTYLSPVQGRCLRTCDLKDCAWQGGFPGPRVWACRHGTAVRCVSIINDILSRLKFRQQSFANHVERDPRKQTSIRFEEVGTNLTNDIEGYD